MHAISSNSGPSKMQQQLIQAAKTLLADVESGRIRSFSCVTLDKDGNSSVYGGSNGIDRYEMLGALTDYCHNFMRLHDCE
jgi:hypothetical protein